MAIKEALLPTGGAAGLGSLAAGAAAAAVPLSIYGALGQTEAGKGLKGIEEEAVKRRKSHDYGIAEAARNLMEGRQARQMEKALQPMTEEVKRTARAQGPLGGGQLTEQLGQLGKSIATGRAQIGSALTQLGSEEARRQRNADIATIQNAWLRRLNILKDIITPQAGAAVFGGGEGTGKAIGEEGVELATTGGKF